ncbi:hypothetical protein [Novosphingobium sp. AAP93]|uniref:hypothetical protein n=1 Tax=Novosphingobium sp. AAP93 TaxID=1523427 RepID=UPI0012E329D8|nr:hypothetical protein [Novosphingobium sp. AAP93]
MARRRAAVALSSIHVAIEHDRPLNAEDVRNHTPATLANIQAKGDAWLVMLAEQHQREEEERRRGGFGTVGAHRPPRGGRSGQSGEGRKRGV